MTDNPDWLKDRIKKHDDEQKRVRVNIDFDQWRAEQAKKKADSEKADSEKGD